MKRVISIVLITILVISQINGINAKVDETKKTETQIEFLMAFGLTREEAVEIEDEEISKLFMSTDIQDVSKLKAKVDKEELEKHKIEIEKNLRIELEDKGYSEEVVEKLITNGYNPSKSIDEQLNEIRNQEAPMALRTADTRHTLIGNIPASYLAGEYNCKFYHSVYPTQIIDDNLNWHYVGYVTPESNSGYALKNEILEFNSDSCWDAAMALFDTTSPVGNANYYMYGEYDGAGDGDSNYHRGVDINYYYEAPIYSIIDRQGIVTYRNYPSDKGSYSFLVIYYSSLNISVVYEHLEIGNLSVGDYVYGGDSIGKESYYGLDYQYKRHTHIQIQSGEVDSYYDIEFLADSFNVISPYSYFTYYSN